MKTTVIKGAAGSGKTEHALKTIAQSVTGTWEYYAPTHKLADEVAARLGQMNPNLRIVVIKGRDHCPDGETPMCKKQAQAAALIETGQSVFPLLCLQSAGKDKPPVTCEHYDQCPYVQQFSAADVFIYPHAYLTLERSVLERRTPVGVVIDESHVLSCVETTTFSIDRLTDGGMPDAAAGLCADIAKAIKSHPITIRGIVKQAISSGQWTSAQKALNRVSAKIKPDMAEDQFNAAVKATKNNKPINALFDNLLRSADSRHAPQSIEFDQEKRMVSVHHRKDILKRFDTSRPGAVPLLSPQMFILDASASHRLMKQFDPELKFVEIPMKRNAHVTQCSSTRCATNSLISFTGSNKPNAKKATTISKRASQQRLKDIQHLLHRFSGEGRKVLVVGPSAVVGNPGKKINSLLKSPPGTDFAHFNALRGIDKWKECDTVIVIGRNQPSILEAERIARGMFFDDPVPLNLTGQWQIQTLGYQWKAGKRGVDVQVHPDPRVQAIVEQIRECESLQAIDRIRLIHNTQIKAVILLSNLPLDIEVDELQTWDEVINGGSRLERAWAGQTNSVMPLNPAWLVEHYPDLWTTVGAAKKDVGRVRKRGQTPNSIFIRSLSPFEYQYKTAGQRNWSWCLSQLSTGAETGKALQKLLGWAVTVRPTPEGEVKKAA